MSARDTVIMVRCTAVPASLRRTGIRCFARIVIDDTLSIDGLTVRRTKDGDYVVTWPERRDSLGRAHAIVRLLDGDSRIQVEEAVLAEAVRGGWAERLPHRHGGAA